MNRKNIALFLALLMLASTAAGCSDSGEKETTADTAAEVITIMTTAIILPATESLDFWKSSSP